MKNDKENYFDCIAMKNNIQKQIYHEIKKMTANELLYYFNQSKESVSNELHLPSIHSPVKPRY